MVAHEIGHAAHWDILLMTVAQLVPLFLYYAHGPLREVSRSKDGKPAFIGAMAAYVLYIIAE